mmetsp:Transcript_17343/g.48323  ORF Transcript_17343/g.48323 Transcript_17343/m.48323 type:complete len:240 (-) Transcript_17343:1414-2133(-)
MCRPELDQARWVMHPAGPSSSCTPVEELTEPSSDTHQTRTLLSQPPVASCLPSGDHSRAATPAVWLVAITCMACGRKPLVAGLATQTLAVLSCPEVAKYRPSGDQLPVVMVPVWPSRATPAVSATVPSGPTPQMRTTVSLLAARCCPVGDHRDTKENFSTLSTCEGASGTGRPGGMSHRVTSMTPDRASWRPDGDQSMSIGRLLAQVMRPAKGSSSGTGKRVSTAWSSENCPSVKMGCT